MDQLQFTQASPADIASLARFDQHLPPDVWPQKIAAGQIFVARDRGQLIACLRCSLFWDLIPFVNLIAVDESTRRQKIGTRLVARFEQEMARLGHRLALTSSQSNEAAQHFWRAIGYCDAGALLLPDQPTEIFFLKSLLGQPQH